MSSTSLFTKYSFLLHPPPSSTSSVSPARHYIPPSLLDQKALILWQKSSWIEYLPFFLPPNKTELALVYSPDTPCLHLKLTVHTVQWNWNCRLRTYLMPTHFLTLMWLKHLFRAVLLDMLRDYFVTAL